MFMTNRMIFAFMAAFILVGTSEASAQWSIDLETGMVFSGYNDVQIPKETGTKFSITDDLETDPNYFLRLRVTYSFNDKHHISAFAAPLRLYASGQVDQLIRFNEVGFAPNVPLKAKYRFDSYRLTYRYDFHRKERLRIGVGFTAKIRDASISLENDEKKTEKKNTGFVPLFNFKIDWMFTQRVGLLVEGDALAGPQGRAEDVLFAVQYKLNDKMRLKLGYRLLEGGADVEEVYNFTLVNYVVVGSMVTF